MHSQLDKNIIQSNLITSDSIISRNYTIFLIIFYFWALVATPQHKFPFLGVIQFEKVIMFLGWAVLVFSNKFRMRFSRITLLILLFYFWMLISYFVSPYQDFILSQLWLKSYWKLIIFYFLILFSINDINDIFYIFAGFVMVLFLYQIHSWYDFLHGGSYVWQQGIKRIVGVWSAEGGMGAPNAFSLVTLFSLPFAIFWFNATKDKKIKVFLSFYFFMSIATIIFSGTRGALVGLIFFLFFTFKRKLKDFKTMALFILIVSILLSIMPEGIKHRYFDLIIFKDKEVQEISDKIAINSALGRVEGLEDGLKLGVKRPIFGYGPGTSAIARNEVRANFRSEGDELELHNLYGQIFSETGLIGTFLFLLIIIIYFFQLYSLKHIKQIDSDNLKSANNYELVLRNSMLLLLFYGFISHILYRYYWLLLFACHGAFIDIVTHNYKDKDANS